METITFTVSLTAADWDERFRGWRCPALQIPGAEVGALYAGSKIDDARYQVDRAQRVIRWAPTEDPPPAPAATIKLTQPLATKKDKDLWQALAVCVPIFVAAIAAYGSYAVQKLKSGAAPTTAASSSTGAAIGTTALLGGFPGENFFEKWTVSGRVKVPGESDPFHIQARVFPPEMAPGPTGIFQTLVAVEHLGDDKRRFPSITFQSKLAGYTPVTVELGANSAAAAPSAAAGGYRQTTYQQNVDVKNRRIDILDPIVVAKAVEPYEEKKAAALQHRALGVPAAERP